MESVLPRLKDNAIIVMDNTPYHFVKLDKAPICATKKADIIKWLQYKGEVIDKLVGLTHDNRSQNQTFALCRHML